MEVTQIPFNKLIEISYSADDDHVLVLAFKENMKNHVGTFHGSAQFALAEACSGMMLQKLFPHLINSAVPLLRRSEVKFKIPAQSDLRAKSFVDVKEKEAFEQQFERKGRGILSLSVEVMDKSSTVTMSGIYEWFIQKL